jgi:adenylate cyclase
MIDRPQVLWQIGDWQVNPDLGEISQNGLSTKLDPRAMRLLVYLAERPGQVISMNEMLEGVWAKSVVTQSSVYEAMAALRQALKDPADRPEYIVTLPRRGYRLIADVEIIATQKKDASACIGQANQPTLTAATTQIEVAALVKPRRRGLALILGTLAVVATFAALEYSHVSRPTLPSISSDKSIAVLPFLDLSERKNQGYFVDGLAEQLLDVLANVPGLRVISRTSSFQFKNRNDDIRSIAAKLGVTYLVEGSVRRDGNQIRVVAQLIRGSDGAHQWSETFIREDTGILQLESDLASSLGRTLELSVENSRIANPVDTLSPEANDHYLRGLNALDPHTRAGTEEAASQFEAALSLDPSFKAAQVSLARAHYVQATYGFLPGTTGIPQARESVAKAALLNPQSAEAHAMLASISTMYDWNWGEAQKEADAALALAPRNPFALFAAGDLATVLGDFERAEAFFRASLATDPLNPETHFMLATLLYGMHQADEAAVEMRRVIAISPDYPTAQVVLANILTMQGRDEAIAECHKAPFASDRFRCLAKARYKLGQFHEAKLDLEKALQIHEYDQAFWIAAVYAYFGDADHAFEYLERAYSQKEPYVEYIKSVPEFDRIRGDKRYRAFLAKLRLPG